jgi:hypothetical protein
VTKEAALPVALIPTSCDAAFALDETIIQLDIVAPAPSRGSRDHAHRKYRKRLETGFIIVGCVAGVLGLLWCCIAFRRARARAKALQAERFAHVQEQVQAARERVGNSVSTYVQFHEP